MAVTIAAYLCVGNAVAAGAGGFAHIGQARSGPVVEQVKNQHGGWGWRAEKSRRGGNEALSAGDIRRVLRGRGFRDIASVQRRGAIFQAEAVGPGGNRVGLVLDARTGAILNTYRLR